MTSCLVFLSILAPSIKVEKCDFDGWSGCWRISNASADLVVVPQVGRIMRFGFLGEANLLFENRTLAGTVADTVKKDWPNFGGDKLWPAPQSDWNWPPDPILDHATLTVRPTDDGVTLHGVRSDGIVFERQIHMAPEGASFRVLNRLTNVGHKPVDRSVWEVCQVNRPDYALLPLPTDSAGGWKELMNPPKATGLIHRLPDQALAEIRLDSKEGHKYGSTSRDGWVSMRVGANRLTLRLAGVDPGAYPDGDCPEEIYTAAEPDSNMELELLGPIRHLGPGTSTSTEVVWTAEKT